MLVIIVEIVASPCCSAARIVVFGGHSPMDVYYCS